MYSWYKHTQENGRLHLTWEEQTSIAGRNNGVIANELKAVIKPIHNPPIGWILPISDKWNKKDYSFIIDIKPKGKEVFLCELDTVFGYSFDTWSPVMLRLKLLYNNITHDELNKKEFIYPEDPEVIYTMLYLYGSFKDGKLLGTWNPPFGTVTALLFWAEAMTFFYEQIKVFDPGFLNANIEFFES